METYSGGDNFKFIWEIENFNFLYPQRGKCLNSPEFFVNVLGPIHLELYPKGDLFDEEEYVILCLNASCKLQDFSVDCELKLITKLGHTVFAKDEASQFPRWKFKRIEFKPIKEQDDGFLTLKATLAVKCQFSQNVVINQNDSTVEDKEDLKILSESIQKMCCNNHLSDFTLTYQDTKFPLHRAILYSRVPKLAEDLKIVERTEATVPEYVSPKISVAVFKSFLTYAYSGKVPTLATDIISGLHYLADVYDVTSLRKKLRCYPNETTARSVIKVDRKSFTWSIKDFDKLELHRKFYGPAFSSGNLPLSDLQFVGCVEEDGSGDHDVKISICRLFPEKDEPIYVKCKLIVVNFTGDEKYQVVGDHFFNNDTQWTLPSFIKMKKIDKERGMYLLKSGHVLCLKGKSFLLNIEFFISGKEIVSNIEDTGSFLTPFTIFAHCADDVQNLSVDLGKLYNIFLPKMSDVILRVGDVRFPAHLVILAARSLVFSRMFEHEMLERKRETVEITDIDVATLNLMLMYMYSGKVDMVLSYDSALKLYAAADKYDINPLRVKCTTLLKSNLTHENVCSLLILADMHSDVRLKVYARDFICENSNVIFLLPVWMDLVHTRPDLASDIIQVLMGVILLHKENCSKCLKKSENDKDRDRLK